MKNALRLWLPAMALALVSLPARAQQGTIVDLWKEKVLPPTVKLKDLNAEWRALSIKGPSAAEEGGAGLGGLAGGLLGAMFGGAMPTPPKAPFYTKGATIVIGSETFLVVYRYTEKSPDFAALMKAAGPPKLPPPAKWTGETSLSMLLLNVRTIESLSDIRPFDLQTEIAEAAKRAEAEEQFRKEMEKGGPGGGLAGLGGLGGLPAPDDITKPAAPAPKKSATAPAKKAPPARK